MNICLRSAYRLAGPIGISVLAFSSALALASNPATKYEFVTGPQTIAQTTCVAVTIGSENNNNQLIPPTETTVTLLSLQNSDIETYSNSQCTAKITDVTFTTSTDEVTFYVAGLSIGSSTITLHTSSGASLNSAVQAETVTFPPPPSCEAHSTPTEPPSPVTWSSPRLAFDEENWTDLNLTGVTGTGSGWYNWNQFGLVTPSADFTVSNECLTEFSDASGFSNGLQTAGSSSPTEGVFGPVSGTTNPIYVEARLLINPSGYTGSGGWPAFWSGGTPGLTSPQTFPYNENDFVEAYPLAKCSQGISPEAAVCLIQTEHTWTAPNTNTSNGGAPLNNNIPALPNNFNFNAFHTFGWLWTTTQVTYYIDGAAKNSVPVPNSADGTGSLPSNPIYLILGTGKNWPTTFEWVHIWN